MRKILISSLILISFLFLSAFEKNSPLTDSEARKIIGQYFGYPKPVMGILHAGPAGTSDILKFREGIGKLVKQGYLKRVPAAGRDEQYEPTTKSGSFVTAAYVKDSYPIFEGAVCREVVKKIDDIHFDPRAKVATISYTVGLEALEPFYSSFCINRYCECFGSKINRKQTQKLKVIDNGMGWHLTS